MTLDLTFSSPTLVTMPQGPREIRRAYPTPAFWALWRKSKDSLRELGIAVIKDSDNRHIVQKISVPETLEPAPEVVGYEIKNKSGLLSYQIAPAGQLVAALYKFGAAIDASDTGTGKTYTALGGVVRELDMRPGIICPKTQKEAWRRVCKIFRCDPLFIESWEAAKESAFPHTEAIYGYKTVSEKYEVVIPGDVHHSEEQLYRHLLTKIPHRPVAFRVLSRVLEDKKTVYILAYSYSKRVVVDLIWKLPKNIILIFDEVHKAKGDKTQASKLLISSKRQNVLALGLSATIAHSPTELRALGYRLGIHNLTDFADFVTRYDCFQDEYRRWHCVDTKSAMLKIHDELFPAKGARIKISDLGDAFPESQVTADTYEIEGAERQNKAYDKLLREIAELTEAKKRNAQAAVLTLRLKYRQLTELLKVPLLASLASDFIEDGLSVVIFVNFSATREKLLEYFEDAEQIHGGQTETERQNAIDNFQNDKARLMVANIASGGVGVSLHDVNGNFPRASIICPTDSAVALKQALGRIHRAGGKSKSLQRIVFAKGTVEEKVCANVAGKLAGISALNDGDLYEPDMLGFLKGTT